MEIYEEMKNYVCKAMLLLPNHVHTNYVFFLCYRLFSNFSIVSSRHRSLKFHIFPTFFNDELADNKLIRNDFVMHSEIFFTCLVLNYCLTFFTPLELTHFFYIIMVLYVVYFDTSMIEKILINMFCGDV
jgi:hypothetical protein